jgi:hypothetical protein
MTDKEIKPFVLKFASEPELYAVSASEKKHLDAARAEKLKLTDLIKVGSDKTTCSVHTEWWSGDGNDQMIDHPSDD